MMNSNVLQALSCNNYGTTLIRGAMYEKAIPEFKLALQLLQNGMQQHQEEEEDDYEEDSDEETEDEMQSVAPEDDNQGDSHLASSSMTEEDANINAQSQHSASSSSASQQLTCPILDGIHHSMAAQQELSCFLQIPSYIYQTPISIPSLPQVCTDQDYTTLTYIVTFNLALACLLSGLSVPDDDAEVCQKRVKTARRLYELTFHMQLEPDILLLTAVLNNLAFVHKYLGNDMEANECEKQLLSAVLYLVDQSVIYKADASVMASLAQTSSSMDGFLGNVMHLIVGTASPASAA
mmetsp:Transcript_1042/g.2458  ORF Transcript_1042/g.2458 Transcript_1042/m.2458 type:complete len:293 (+) Transcript_1042:132-1010(+)